MAVDAVIVCSSLVLALCFRFEFWPAKAEWARLLGMLPLLVSARLCALAVGGLYNWSFRLSGLPEAVSIIKAQVVGSLLFVSALLLVSGHQGIGSRGVLVMEFIISTFLLTAVRFGPRIYWGRAALAAVRRSPTALRTIIVGAGQAGNLLVRDLSQQVKDPTFVVGFVDDDKSKHNVTVQGYRVMGSVDDLPPLIARRSIRQVIIAIPSAKGPDIRRIVDKCKGTGVSIRMLPFSVRYSENLAAATMLRDMDPADLLGRPEVEIDYDEFADFFVGRTVLVSGASGSIGSEIARQVAAFRPSRLVLLDMNENGLYMLDLELKSIAPEVDVRLVVANIREAEAMHSLLCGMKPSIVLHAAAHKHVPLMETSPCEAVKNNVFGTRNLASAAVKAGAEAFLMISTDKAVNPTSVMGATKRVAEYVVRRIGAEGPTRFVAVRFGNVLGSAGSVIPIFREQIRRGGPVTVTHPDMRRYFMTVHEAVSLCLMTVVRPLGTVCVLDMGEQMRISHLAENLIAMAGLVPGRDIEIRYTGLRPGEKLFEELMTEAEETTRQVHPKIMTTDNSYIPADLEAELEKLGRITECGDSSGCVEVLKILVPTFKHEPFAPAAPQPAENPARPDAPEERRTAAFGA